MEKTAQLQKKTLSQKLDTSYAGKKLGIWISFGASVLSLILSLPFIKWVWIVNEANLYKYMDVEADVAATLDSSYSLFNLLKYVQYSGFGILGLFSMILLILIVVATYFNVVYIVKVIGKITGKKGNLSLYGTGLVSAVFNALTSAATVVFVLFANEQFRMTGMIPSPVVFVVFAFAIVSYICVKKLEAIEWAIYHEHGFFMEIKKNWVLFLMLVPTFVYFMINNYLPMVGVYYAFTQFNFRDGLWASPFVGFKNFDYLVSADLFKLTRNTVLYNLVFILLGNALQIFFAILVSQVTKKWFKKVSQTLMFMPYFVSFVILKVLVYNIFEYDYGLINTFVVALGGERIDFYNTPSYWPFLITAFYIWKNIGYGMVVYLATIMGIDNEMYDAAKVDGANIFQQIRYITLPQLKPTFIILLLYALGSIMKGQFELFYQMIGTNGVLYNITDILDTYVYRIAMTQPLSIGLGTAAGLYQSVFGFVVIVVTNWIVKRKNSEYALF